MRCGRAGGSAFARLSRVGDRVHAPVRRARGPFCARAHTWRAQRFLHLLRQRKRMRAASTLANARSTYTMGGRAIMPRSCCAGATRGPDSLVRQRAAGERRPTRRRSELSFDEKGHVFDNCPQVHERNTWGTQLFESCRAPPQQAWGGGTQPLV
eukprot:4997823-Prymnesium_polylepis.1